MCKIQDVIDHFGSQVKLAEALNVTQGAVSQWVTAGGLPPGRAIEIERLTVGKFKAVDFALIVEGV